MAQYIELPTDARAKEILEGFKVISLTLKNADTGEVAWTSDADWGKDCFTVVKDAHLPSAMLKYPAVGREIVFSTVNPISGFRIEQQVIVHDKPLEQWNFDFGFVIPGSENSWETIVQAAGEGNMLPAAFLSGNMYIVTAFFAQGQLISKSVVRVFYD